MRNSRILFAILAVLVLFPVLSFAQNAQTFHTASLLLDDGNGHSIILLPPNTGSGLQTFSFPTGGGTVATTGYVTSQLGNYLPLSGGTLTGSLAIGGTTTLGYASVATGATVSTIAASIYSVADNGTANSTSSVSFTAAGTNGQVLIVTTEDPDGVAITIGGTTYNIGPSIAVRFVYTGTSWKAEF